MPILIGAKGATIGGVNYAPYTYIDWFTPDLEATAVQGGNAAVVPARGLSPAEALAVRSLVSKDGTTGVWRGLPASGVIMRVRMTGTGTLSMDSATGDLGAGTVTTAAYSATVAGTQIDDYAYPGDAARSIRFTLTGTAAVEVY